MKVQRVVAVIVLISIILYGIFRGPLLHLYATVLDLIVDTSIITETFNQISSRKAYRQELAGWIIYYPTYLLLHIVFIFILFNKNKKARNYISIAVISTVFLLITLVILSKVFTLPDLYKFSYGLFQNLFGLPFILLFIEGGRILYNDIIEMQSRENG